MCVFNHKILRSSAAGNQRPQLARCSNLHCPVSLDIFAVVFSELAINVETVGRKTIFLFLLVVHRDFRHSSNQPLLHPKPTPQLRNRSALVVAHPATPRKFHKSLAAADTLVFKRLVEHLIIRQKEAHNPSSHRNYNRTSRLPTRHAGVTWANLASINLLALTSIQHIVQCNSSVGRGYL